MTPPLVAAAVGLASIAVATALGSLLAAVALRLMQSGVAAGLGSRTRASLLAQARLAPAVVFVPLAAVVQVAFWRYEPAHGGERLGPLLVGLAVIGAVLALRSAVRLLTELRATRRLRRHWRAVARPVSVPGWSGRAYRVDAEFPVVAVVGMWRPELFVAARVEAACSPVEIAVVAAHERAHVAALDNLTRAAFAATPLPARLSSRLEQAWAAAAEEAADLAARNGGSGVTLAAALLKVARLALPAAAPPRSALASALIGAGGLEPRVRRLLAPPPTLGRASWWLSAAFTAGLVAASSSLLRQVYDIAEFVVAAGR